MRLKLTAPAAILSSALVLAAAPAAAEWNAREVLGDEGERYTVRSAPLKSTDSTAGGSLLELEIERSGEETVRRVVPGTEGKDPDLNPHLIFDDASSTLFILWETKVSGIFSQIRLIWIQDGAWSEPVHVQSNPYAVRKAAHLAVTRDRFHEEVRGEVVERQRTLIHIAWWEDSDGGQIVYAPLALVNGVLTDESRSYSLQEIVMADLGSDAEPGACFGADAGVHEVLALQAVQKGAREAALVTFTEQTSGCLHTVQIAPVPGDLVSLGDKLRAHIIEIGNRFRPSDVDSLADKLRAHIIEVGNRLEPPVRNTLARAVHDRVVEVGPDHGLDPEGLDSLSDDLRAHIIEIGRQLESISAVRQKSTARASTIEIGDVWSEGSGHPHQLIELRQLATRSVPEGMGEEPRFLLSPDARRAVIAWDAGESVRYRETVQDGWSQVRSLAYDDAEERDQVYELLSDRVQR